MRVLHIDTGTGWRGGQQQVFWLMQGLDQRGVEQLLLAPAGSPLAARARCAGLEVAELGTPAVSRANWHAARVHASEMDLLHAHDAHAQMLAAAAVLGGRDGPVSVVSRRTGFPVRRVGRLKYRFATHYIAVSEYVRWQLLQAGVPAEKITAIYDGVRSPDVLPPASFRIEMRQRQDTPQGAFVIGMLTPLAPEKRLPEALALLQRLPATVHLWIGVPAAEPDRAFEGMNLLEEASQLGLKERFRLIPLGEYPGAFLSSLDLFLYLSRSEGLGSAILLAMAYGLPVAASQAGGIPEIVRHMETGILLDPDNFGTLPPAIQLLQHSPQLRARLGCAACDFVLEHATDTIMTDRTLALYQKLIDERRSVPSGRKVSA